MTRGAGHMHSEKSQRAQNGTMFVDLDWPLNASRRLSASAELLVHWGKSEPGPKAESGWGGGWIFFREGQQPRSPQTRGSVMGSLWALSSGFGAKPWPPKGFPLFSALRSQDGRSWYCNIVTCGLPYSHWGEDPCAPPPLAYTHDQSHGSFWRQLGYYREIEYVEVYIRK